MLLQAAPRILPFTVKGTNIAPPTEEELLAILNKYYTTDQFTDFINKNEVVDLNNCQADFSLPRYTRIKDENDQFQQYLTMAEPP